MQKIPRTFWTCRDFRVENFYSVHDQAKFWTQPETGVCVGGGLLGFIFNWKNDSQDM